MDKGARAKVERIKVFRDVRKLKVERISELNRTDGGIKRRGKECADDGDPKGRVIPSQVHQTNESNRVVCIKSTNSNRTRQHHALCCSRSLCSLATHEKTPHAPPHHTPDLFHPQLFQHNPLYPHIISNRRPRKLGAIGFPIGGEGKGGGGAVRGPEGVE